MGIVSVHIMGVPAFGSVMIVIMVMIVVVIVMMIVMMIVVMMIIMIGFSIQPTCNIGDF